MKFTTMAICKECGNATYDYLLLCRNCFRNLIQTINTLRPSDVHDLTDIFPSYIIETMDDFLQKDLNEALNCIAFELWTATVLMCSRILESSLKIHLNHDLKCEKDFSSIGECITALDAYYPPEFTDHLNKLRELRNDAMHGEKRFSSESAIVIWHRVFIVIAWIYNNI